MTDGVPLLWQPTRLRLVAGVIGTSTRPVRIRTDAGDAHVKVMGNPRGEHILVAEYLGTAVASLLGLPTFDVAILRLAPCDEIDLGDGLRATPGPAFATRTMLGRAWGGVADELEQILNPKDVALLVVADTLLRNPDRHDRIPPREGAVARRPRPDNVFLSSEDVVDGRCRLVAMDFSDCLTAGREITRRVAHIDSVQDDGIYGLFPEFRSLMTRARIEVAAGRLAAVSRERVGRIVEAVPHEWQLTREAGEAVTTMISTRAAWLADSIGGRLVSLCQPQGDLFEEPPPGAKDDR